MFTQAGLCAALTSGKGKSGQNCESCAKVFFEQKLCKSVEVGLARFERAGDGRGKLYMQTPNEVKGENLSYFVREYTSLEINVFFPIFRT